MAYRLSRANREYKPTSVHVVTFECMQLERLNYSQVSINYSSISYRGLTLVVHTNAAI